MNKKYYSLLLLLQIPVTQGCELPVCHYYDPESSMPAYQLAPDEHDSLSPYDYSFCKFTIPCTQDMPINVIQSRMEFSGADGDYHFHGDIRIAGEGTHIGLWEHTVSQTSPPVSLFHARIAASDTATLETRGADGKSTFKAPVALSTEGRCIVTYDARHIVESMITVNSGGRLSALHSGHLDLTESSSVILRGSQDPDNKTYSILEIDNAQLSARGPVTLHKGGGLKVSGKSLITLDSTIRLQVDEEDKSTLMPYISLGVLNKNDRPEMNFNNKTYLGPGNHFETVEGRCEVF